VPIDHVEANKVKILGNFTAEYVHNLACSYRVGGVEGSCAKHLTIKLKILYGRYAANIHTY